MNPAALVSVSTVVLDGHPFERGLDLLAQAGAVLVEPAFIEGYMPFNEDSFREAEARRLASMLAAAGLSARAVSAHIDLGGPDSLEKLRRRLGFAATLGAKILVSNATTVDRAPRFQDVMTAVLPELAASGLTLALENPGHGSGAMIPDGKRGAALLSSFDSPHLRMNYDIGNAASYGARSGTAAEDLAAALPVAAHVHLKDLRDMDGDWYFCPLGEGDIGYGTTIALDRIPPHLPMGIEYPIRLWRPGHGDPKRREEVPSEKTIIATVRNMLEFVTTARSSPDQC